MAGAEAELASLLGMGSKMHPRSNTSSPNITISAKGVIVVIAEVVVIVIVAAVSLAVVETEVY